MAAEERVMIAVPVRIELSKQDYKMLKELAARRGEKLYQYVAGLLEENGLLSASLEAGLDRARHAVLQRKAQGN